MRILCCRKLSNLNVKGKKTIYLPSTLTGQLKKKKERKHENWHKEWDICNRKKAVIFIKATAVSVSHSMNGQQTNSSPLFLLICCQLLMKY